MWMKQFNQFALASIPQLDGIVSTLFFWQQLTLVGIHDREETSEYVVCNA